MSFKEVKLEQGTKEWLEFRLDYLAASDVPVALGLSPYRSNLELYLEKLNRTVKDTQELTWPQRKGHQAEELAREWMKEENRNFPPKVVTNCDYPNLLASLDGYEASTEIIFESKWMGKVKYEDCKNAIIPLTHMYQVQTQLLLTGAKGCIYFATMDNPEVKGELIGLKVDVFPDPQLQREIVELSNDFMALVRMGQPPLMTMKNGKEYKPRKKKES